MTINGRRRTLLVIWGLFFVLVLGYLVVILLCGWIESDTFLAGLTVIGTGYGPYIGIMLTSLWTQRNHPSETSDDPAGAFVAAIMVSVVWNAVFVSLIFQPLFTDTGLEKALADVQKAQAVLALPVAALITFYYGKPS